MNKVWTLYHYNYEEIVGVYSSKEKAIEAQKKEMERCKEAEYNLPIWDWVLDE